MKTGEPILIFGNVRFTVYGDGGSGDPFSFDVVHGNRFVSPYGFSALGFFDLSLPLPWPSATEPRVSKRVQVARREMLVIEEAMGKS